MTTTLPTAVTDIRAACILMVEALRQPGMERLYPGATYHAGYLSMLLDSCTPDAGELLEDELRKMIILLKGKE